MQQMSFTNIFRGARGLSQPPIDDIESYWSPAEKTQATSVLARSTVGSPDTVRASIDALITETGADELMIVSDVYDHAKRLRYFELIAGVAGIAANLLGSRCIAFKLLGVRFAPKPAVRADEALPLSASNRARSKECAQNRRSW